MSYKHTKIIRFLSLCLCFCLIFEQTGLSQVLPSALNPGFSTPPLLRYLSVNSNNPFNYFNFLLDKGLSPQGTVPDLTREAKKLISYFFLGITLPSSSFWVNLRPDSPDRITSEELAKTDLGRVLLEQDLQLKKDVSKYLHPNHPQGKEYWERLYSTIGKDKAKKAKITTSNRVWIVPEEAVVLETEDGALVVEAKLKVLLENEYFSSKKGLSPPELSQSQLKGTVPKSQEENIQLLSEQLMKEIILPEITQEVNTSPNYAPLRQIYHSLILAEWFKRKVSRLTSEPVSQLNALTGTQANPQTGTPINPYAPYINSSITKGLESEAPWEKDTFYQQYLNSYSKGEYKLEANLFGLRRMYWSGGMELTNIGPMITAIKGADIAGSPLTLIEDTELRNQLFNPMAVIVEETSVVVPEKGEFPKGKSILILPPKKIEKEAIQEEASRSPEKGLSARKPKNQPTEGVSFDLSIASVGEKDKGIDRRGFLKTFGTVSGLGILATAINSFWPLEVLANGYRESQRKEVKRLKEFIFYNKSATEEKKEKALWRLSGIEIPESVEALKEIFFSNLLSNRLRVFALDGIMVMGIPDAKQTLIELIPEFEKIFFSVRDILLGTSIEAWFKAVEIKHKSPLKVSHVVNKFLKDLIRKLNNNKELETILQIVSVIDKFCFQIHHNTLAINKLTVFSENKNYLKESLIKIIEKFILDENADKNTFDVVITSMFILRDIINLDSRFADEIFLALKDTLPNILNDKYLENRSSIRLRELVRVLEGIFSLTSRVFKVNFIAELATDDSRVEFNLRNRLNNLSSYHPPLWKNISEAIGYRLIDIISGKIQLNKILEIILEPKFAREIESLSLGMGATWSLALACVQNMEKFDIDFTSENIGEIIQLVIDNLKSILGKKIYSKTTREVIIVNHQEERFRDMEHREAAVKAGVPPYRIKSFKGKKGDSPKIKKELLTALSRSSGETVFVFNGHGGEQDFWLSDDTEISYGDLCGALLTRVKNGGSLKDLIIILDACYTFDFAVYLVTDLQGLLAMNNLPLDTPIIFTLSNKDKWAYGGAQKYYYKGDRKKNITIGDLFYSQDNVNNFADQDPALFCPINEEMLRRFEDLGKKSIIENNMISIPVRYMVGFIHSKDLSQYQLVQIVNDIRNNAKELTQEQKAQMKAVFEHLKRKVEKAEIKADIKESILTKIGQLEQQGNVLTFGSSIGIRSPTEYVLATPLDTNEITLIEGFFNYPPIANNIDFQAEGLSHEILALLYPETSHTDHKARYASADSLPEGFSSELAGIQRDVFGQENKLKEALREYVRQSASSAVVSETPDKTGGIDFSQIELTLKDEKYISSLNPAERQILLAAKYFKDGWESLTLLYIHQIMLMLKDNLIQDLQNRDLLFGILQQLQTKDFLDPQAIRFLQFLHSQKPLSEIKMVLVR